MDDVNGCACGYLYMYWYVVNYFVRASIEELTIFDLRCIVMPTKVNENQRMSLSEGPPTQSKRKRRGLMETL